MAIPIINLEPDLVLIPSNYLYHEEDLDKVEPYEEAYLATLKSAPCRLFQFECLIPSWPGLRDKLPIEAIFWREPIGRIYPSAVLQRWECFDHDIYAIKKTIVESVPVEVTLVLEDGTRVIEWGRYRYTIDTEPSEIDVSFVSDPTEAKSFNFIQLNNGQYALLPNNQCRFAPPSLVERPLTPVKVKPKVADQIYYAAEQSVSHMESYLYESDAPSSSESKD